MKILLIEDEIKIANFIHRGLKEFGMVVECAYNGEEALYYISEASLFDLIILDWMLPDIDGISVLKTLRSNCNRSSSTPVIMLTAKGAVSDKVEGLDAGADDYLVKPFSFEELLARIRAIARRGKETSTKEDILQLDNLLLDSRKRKVFRNNKEISLSNREYTLLEYLIKNKNYVLSRSMIIENVWGMTHDSGTNIVEVTINHLRSKIDHQVDRKLLHTLRGQGYLLGLNNHYN